MTWTSPWQPEPWPFEPEAPGSVAERPRPASPGVAGAGRRALRNTILILIVRVISRVIALVTVVIVSHALGDTGFGQMQTAVTYSTLASIVADFGFATLYVREGARSPGTISRLLSFAMSARVFLTVLSAPLLLAGLWFAGVQSLFLPSFALIVIGGYLMLLRSTLYALQRLNFEIVEIVPESLLLLGLVLLGSRLHGDAGYFLWAYVISYAVAALYFVVVVLRAQMVRPRWNLDAAMVRPWLTVGVSLAITYLLTTVYFKVDVPILQHFRSYAEVGWYTLAYKPFEALLFIPVTLRSVIFPVMSLYNRASPDLVLPTSERFFKALALIGWPITVGVFVLTPQFNDLLQLYPQSEASLHILAIAVFFAFVDNTFAATFNAVDKQKTFAFIALGGLAINLGLNLFLIPLYGYLGASWSTVITEIALVAIGWTVLRVQVGTLHVIRGTWRIYPAGAVMGLFVYLVHPQGRVPLLVVTAAAAIIYGVLIVLFRVLDASELSALRGMVRNRFSS